MSKAFEHFARKQSIAGVDLWDAVERADRGLVDADLGGGVIKQRIARPNEGRSGGYRTIIVFRIGARAVFVHGYGKNDQANITKGELRDFKDAAKILLGLGPEELERALASGALIEVARNE